MDTTLQLCVVELGECACLPAVVLGAAAVSSVHLDLALVRLFKCSSLPGRPYCLSWLHLEVHDFYCCRPGLRAHSSLRSNFENSAAGSICCTVSRVQGTEKVPHCNLPSAALTVGNVCLPSSELAFAVGVEVIPHPRKVSGGRRRRSSVDQAFCLSSVFTVHTDHSFSSHIVVGNV